jgi:hypothetical protein
VPVSKVCYFRHCLRFDVRSRIQFEHRDLWHMVFG